MPAATAIFLTRRATSWSLSRSDVLALAGDPAEEGTFGNLREFYPVFQRRDGAGGVGRVAADLDLAPAGFPTQGQKRPLVEDFDPATTVFRLVATEVEAGDFRATQAASEANEQHGPVANAAQRSPIERFQHGDQLFRQDRFLLARRGGMPVADASYDGCDRPVLAVQWHAALRTVPADGGEAPLDGRHGVRLVVARRRAKGTAGGAGGDVEPDDFWIRGGG